MRQPRYKWLLRAIAHPIVDSHRVSGSGSAAGPAVVRQRFGGRKYAVRPVPFVSSGAAVSRDLQLAMMNCGGALNIYSRATITVDASQFSVNDAVFGDTMFI
ncbi:hypothetical protein GCM10011591_38060 [Nocardia camponoti]|uniref:Uncharacterized protein n=1 Tax=Nocardia camponoti TaxID=1616106 RepID=A0A917QP96_9NOCA|nr:hypothetical protein GCM10011591_38060 [Nocardia camponoti]